MRISIWQQFSSNHSGSFTVIGEFTTPDNALRAADEIRAVIRKIADWHEQHHVEIEHQSDDDWRDIPSPIEQELATKYNLVWDRPIDWFWNVHVTIVLDRLVVITNDHQVETDGQPFHEMMNRLGGKGYHDGVLYGENTGLILFDLTFQAPDESTVQSLYERYLGYSQRIKRDGMLIHFARWQLREHADLSKLIKELEAQGCTEIEYQFRQVSTDQAFDELLHTPSDVEVLLEVLTKSDNVYERTNAANALGRIGDRRATPALIEALTSSDEWLRRAAVTALADIADLRAVEPLIQNLTDPNTWTRQTIVVALGKFADSRVIDPLISCLADNYTWEAAANALGSTGLQALEPLQKALANSGETVRYRVEKALERAQETMKGGQQLADLRSPHEPTRQLALEALKLAPRPEILVAYLRNPGTVYAPNVQAQVIDLLLNVNDPRLVPILAERVLYIGGLAIHTLIQIGESAVETLMELAKNHSEQWVRESAFSGLSQLADPRAFDLMIEMLKTPDRILREKAVVGLGKLGDPRAIEPIVEGLRLGWEGGISANDRAALDALRRLNAEAEVVDFLIPHLQQTGWRSAHVVNLLGEIGSLRAIEPLRALLKTADAESKPLIEAVLQKLERKKSE